MGLPPSKPTHYSVNDYLRLERDSEEKHEYHDGQIIAMAGGSAAHSLITANVIRELGNALKTKPCRVYDSNLRVRIHRTTLFAYPDATVICGQPEYDPQDPDHQTITNPRLIVEVLSPSTERFDRGQKFEWYRQSPAFQEYILISQSAPTVETFLRRPDGAWLFNVFSGPDAAAAFQSLELTVPLSEIFAGVDFALPPAATA